MLGLAPRGRAALVILLAALSAGCGEPVGMRLDTVVDPDGWFTRRFHLAAASAEGLQEEYILPAGGAWERTRLTHPSWLGAALHRRHHYRARGAFWQLTTDYARRDSARPPRFSKNSLEIRVTADRIAYRETFADTTDGPQLLTLLGGYVGEYVHLVGRRLAETAWRAEPEASRAAWESAAQAAMQTWLAETWAAVRAIVDERSERAALAHLHRGPTVLVDALTRAWTARGSEAPTPKPAVKLVEAAVQAVHRDPATAASLGERYAAPLRTLAGAYLPQWRTQRYPFQVTLTMPGPIVETNAHHVSGRRAVWTFSAWAFALKDLTLHATAVRPTPPPATTEPPPVMPPADTPPAESPPPDEPAPPAETSEDDVPWTPPGL